MTEELKKRLEFLASKYETNAFPDADPSQFLKWYSKAEDIEVSAFIAAMLSFGNRKQFIPKIKEIFLLADKKGGICNWILSSAWVKDFRTSDENDEIKFYRFYSYGDMKELFSVFKKLLNEYGSFSNYLRKYNSVSEVVEAVSLAFCDCSIVPKGKNSANKRLYMFLRWMIRRNSPVDLGLWDWLSPEELIIPLDTHVIQESVKLGLIPENSAASLKTAIKITEELKKVWPDDPCKGDFALFGLGVDE